MKAILYIIRNQALSQLEYKFDYVLLLFSSLFTFLTQWALFNHLPEEAVKNWSRNQLFVFTVIGIFIRSSQMLWTVVNTFVDEIRQGSFRKYLCLPINFNCYYWAYAIGPKLPTWLTSIGILVLFKVFHPDAHSLLPTIPSIIMFLTSFIVAITLLWSIYLSIIYLGIFFDDCHFLAYALNISLGVLSGTIIPLEWLPNYMQTFIKNSFLIHLGHFPLHSALGHYNWVQFTKFLTQGLTWAVILIVLNISLKKYAIKRYESYGG